MKARFQTPDYHTSSALNRRMKTIGLRSSSKTVSSPGISSAMTGIGSAEDPAMVTGSGQSRVFSRAGRTAGITLQ